MTLAIANVHDKRMGYQLDKAKKVTVNKYFYILKTSHIPKKCA